MKQKHRSAPGRDLKAYELGLNNSTTAKDLMTIMEAIADHSEGTEKDCEAIAEILNDQKFNEMILRYLSDDVKVDHNTGFLARLHHDAAIVYLPGGGSSVSILLSKNLKDFDKVTEQLAIRKFVSCCEIFK